MARLSPNIIVNVYMLRFFGPQKKPPQVLNVEFGPILDAPEN